MNDEKNEKSLVGLEKTHLTETEKEIDVVKKEEEKETEDKKSEDSNKVNKKKRKLSKQMLIIIIVSVICIVITAILIILKINLLKNNQIDNNGNVAEKVFENEKQKKQAEDAKYVCKNFNETYNNNAIEIKTVKENKENIEIEYPQISGLKDTSIENKINTEIKETALSIGTQNLSDRNEVNYIIEANFSNVLSVQLHKISYKNISDYEVKDVDEKIKCLNYNLVTGEKLKFKDLFVSSAPVNSIVADAVYTALAWDTELNLDLSEEEYDKRANMDRRDTSEYEDILLKTINKFKNKDGDIDFTFSPTVLHIYNLYEGSDNFYSGRMRLNMMDYIDNLTIFKKYADADIYTDSSNALKNIPVFTTTFATDVRTGIYGKQSDNLFVDFGIWQGQDEISNDVSNKILLDVKNRINPKIENLKKDNSKGYVYQGSAYIMKYYDKYISAGICTSEAEMSKEYYSNELFKRLAEINIKPASSIEGHFIGSFKEENEKLGINGKNENQTLYYDINGNYLGDNEEVIKKKEEKNINQNYINNNHNTDNNIGLS